MLPTNTSTDSFTAAQLGELRDLVATYCGVYLDDTRVAPLEAAVRRRALALGRTVEAYTRALRGPDSAELQRLSELLLNHETQFFRNRPHIHALRAAIIPELHRRLPPGEPLRLWSAGCATGEEPYSLAITALEALGDPLPRPVEIWATDLSEAALAKARAGRYQGRTLANVTLQQRARFFNAQGGALEVTERVRRLVRFEQLNLLDPFPPAARGMHGIFCQNVTIYFQAAACRALMGRFYEAMADGGALFLGFSETLWQLFDRFQWREVAGAYVYYKEPQKLAPPGLASQPATRSASSMERRPRPGSPSAARSGEATLARGRELLDAGQLDAALELFAATPLTGSSAPSMLALTARAHADRGELELAAAEARRALELNPLTTEAHLLIGLIYARQGRYGAAIGQLERAQSLDGGSPVIAFHLAECYRQVGRTESALRAYRATIVRLAAHPPDRLIDGVAAGWLRETCRRYEALLSGERRER
jgi:chemotaxis protein methyltransferase CheR